MKRRKKIQPFLWAFLFIITTPFSVLSAGRKIEISQVPSTVFPIVINRSGNYILTSDLKITAAELLTDNNWNGIEISADDVILDLNGHTITGCDLKGIGIHTSERKNIKIKNGTIQNFLCGINLSGNNLEVAEINACSNSLEGIKAASSIINNCKANGNGSHGIYAKYSSLDNCSADYNLSCGIRVESSTARNCKVNDNGSHGIYAEGSLVEDCNLFKNKKYGLFLIHHSSGIKNEARDNGNGNFYSHGLNHMPIKVNKALEKPNLQGDDANYGF